MDLIRIYTICKLASDGSGGYGTLVMYTDSKGVTHEKSLTQGETGVEKTRLELKSIIEGIEILNKPCNIEVFTESRFIIDAIRFNWIEKWVENNWKRRGDIPVKNVDLWERLIDNMQDHVIIFKRIEAEDRTEEMIRCDKLASDALESAVFLGDITN